MKCKVHLQLVPLPEAGSSVPMHTRSGSCVQGREETVRGGGSLSLGWFSHVGILWWVLSLKDWGTQTIHALPTKDTVGSAPVQTLVLWGDLQGVRHKIWAALGLLAVLCPECLSWSCAQLRAAQELLPEARWNAEPRTRLQFSNATVSGRAVVVQPKAGGWGLGIFGCVFDQCAFHAVLK